MPGVAHPDFTSRGAAVVGDAARLLTIMSMTAHGLEIPSDSHGVHWLSGRIASAFLRHGFLPPIAVMTGCRFSGQTYIGMDDDGDLVGNAFNIDNQTGSYEWTDDEGRTYRYIQAITDSGVQRRYPDDVHVGIGFGDPIIIWNRSNDAAHRGGTNQPTAEVDFAFRTTGLTNQSTWEVAFFLTPRGIQPGQVASVDELGDGTDKLEVRILHHMPVQTKIGSAYAGVHHWYLASDTTRIERKTDVKTMSLSPLFDSNGDRQDNRTPPAETLAAYDFGDTIDPSDGIGYGLQPGTNALHQIVGVRFKNPDREFGPYLWANAVQSYAVEGHITSRYDGTGIKTYSSDLYKQAIGYLIDSTLMPFVSMLWINTEPRDDANTLADIKEWIEDRHARLTEIGITNKMVVVVVEPLTDSTGATAEIERERTERWAEQSRAARDSLSAADKADTVIVDLYEHTLGHNFAAGSGSDDRTRAKAWLTAASYGGDFAVGGTVVDVVNGSEDGELASSSGHMTTGNAAVVMVDWFKTALQNAAQAGGGSQQLHAATAALATGVLG